MSFKSRLKLMLDGRPLTGWGKQNKLSGGTISRISGGGVPGHQILNLIQKIENVSIGWLVDGIGRPFIVHDEFSDEQTAGYLATLLEEQGWRLYFVTDQTNMALVCTLPAEIEFKKNRVRYTAVEIICGQYGAETQAVLNGFDNIYLLKIDRETLTSLCRGEIGTHRLVGNDECTGLLAQAQPMDQPPEQPEIQAIAEDSPDDYALLAKYHQLNAANRKTLLMIIDTLLKQQE